MLSSPLTPNAEIDAVRRNFQLLVVEDNQADVWLVKEAVDFHQVPVDVRVIHDGEKAIEFLEQIGPIGGCACPSILLLDLNLPKKSGREVLRYLRSSGKCRNMPVVIMTSSDSARDRADMNELGATLYFHKPAELQSFLKLGDTLNRLLNQIS